MNSKRLFVYKDLHEKDGKVIMLEGNIDNLKLIITKKFGLNQDKISLYLANNCIIDDIRLLRDNEKLYLSVNNDLHHTSEKHEKNEPKLEKNKPKSDWISLNIGGERFTTSKSTLKAKEPSSMLARMFAEDNDSYLMNPSELDSNGAYLIDRSPEYFKPILNFLRHGDVILDSNVNPKGVLEEARFYGIESMIPILNDLIEKQESNINKDNIALTRMDVVRVLINSPTEAELRFQGVNLAGADLSKLDLRNINFKYACLSRCNLSGVNLSHCCLERADLSHANLEGAQLLGVKALCANMEGANLRHSYMEDPAGTKAILEGVNLKGANLEGSNMAGVNLRVATLKHANLQNCDLRTAILAGADLECCDLSGSDLHEANLRGANLKDAAFELMLTPLHMSQTIR